MCSISHCTTTKQASFQFLQIIATPFLHLLSPSNFTLIVTDLKRHFAYFNLQSFSSAHFSGSVMSHSATPWSAACRVSLSVTNSQSLLKLMPIESVMPSNHLILCCPLLLPPSVFHSIRVFSSESVLCIRWPNYWSFIFSINPSNEYSGLISFRTDWLDLLAV